MKNIITAGGWYVGNTAILDWLDGFENLRYIKGDFNICRQENGIMDILSADSETEKLKMLKVIKKDCLLSFRILIRTFIGRYTKHLFKRVKPKPFNTEFSYYKELYIFADKYIDSLVSGDKFDEYEYCRQWMQEIATNSKNINSVDKANVSVVFQNPFFYDQTYSGHSQVWPRLFQPYKLIFVHRDPLDQFFDIISSGDHLISSWPRFHGDTVDLHPADRFLNISKKIYQARIEMLKGYSNNDVLVFSFEDFLLKHEVITTRLEHFIGDCGKRDVNNNRFVLDESLQNIGRGHKSEELLRLLEGKEYVMDELNALRNELIALGSNN